MDSSREALTPDERGIGDPPGKSHGKLALALGAIAIALSLVLGIVYLNSVRRLEREVARLSQQTEGLSRLVARAQEQSQALAQLPGLYPEEIDYLRTLPQFAHTDDGFFDRSMPRKYCGVSPFAMSYHEPTCSIGTSTSA